MINRDKYLNELIKSRHNGFPKVITGVRRCGKSYLLKIIYKNYLIKNGVDESDIVVIELDSDSNIFYRNPIELGKFIRNLAKTRRRCYVFIDEIQLVDTIINPAYTDGKIVLAKYKEDHTISFVDVVLGLSREENIDLYVTGSNSKMLSSDIVTEFRDKATNIHMRPLSFEEYYNYVGGSKEKSLIDYLNYGGMPLSVLYEKEEDKRTYLVNLFKLTYFKDILDRNSLKRSEMLDDICNVISESLSQLTNTNRIYEVCKNKYGNQIDKETIDKYVSLFEDAYLVQLAKRYDIKGNKEIGSLKKYYFVDNGLRNARINFAYSDEGHLLENMIYNELIYNGYAVNVGVFEKIEKDKNGKSVRKEYEIDFVAKRDYRKYYIQVCSNIDSIETKEREIRPFISLKDNIQKVIVINKPISEKRDENGITVIGVYDFIFKFIK